MLRWFRCRARAVASAVLIAVVALGGLSSAAHGTDCHDEECRIDARHDPTEHRLQPAKGAASGAPLHCIVCHWTRTPRPSPAVVQHAAPRIDIAMRPQLDAPRVVSSSRSPQPPLRSPPSASALNA